MRHGWVVVCLLLAAGCGGGAGKAAWEALPLGTKADFDDIWFADATHGWIAGGSYEITGGIVGRTSDGGKTWRFVSNLTKREGMTVSSIHFFDSNRGIAATSTGDLLSTLDGGETWTSVDRQGRVGGLSSMSFVDERRGWAAGVGDVIRTDDAGEHWAPASSENMDANYRSPIRAMQFLDDRNGWVAGMQSYLARTTNGGGTWESVSAFIAGTERPNFWDVSFVDSQFGWVVGEEGSMLSTSDGGTTWMIRSIGLKDAPGFTISAVRFIDRNRGWITGFYPNLGRSLILRTDDAGATWVVDMDIAGEELRALFIQGHETAWAIGSRTREGSQAIYRRTLAVK